MAEFDHGIKQIADTTTRELARVAGLKCGRLQPLEGTLPATTELLADRAFRTRQGSERFIVYFEFYTYWDRRAPWDMLAKAGLLSQRERMPTVCLAFVLLPRRFRSLGGQFRLEAGGKPTQQLWFREVCLWEVEPESWWEKAPGLMALYPLCRHRRTPRDAIRHAAEVINNTVTTQGERQDRLFLLNIFGELAYPRLDVERLIGSDVMIRESKLARRLRKEGQIETRQEDLLIVVRGRFNDAVATELAASIHALDDLELLEQLLRLASSGSLEELRSTLPSQRS